MTIEEAQKFIRIFRYSPFFKVEIIKQNKKSKSKKPCKY